MTRTIRMWMCLLVAGMTGTGLLAEEKEKKMSTSVHDFEVKDIDGNGVSLSKYKGRTLLIVNVASECGLTPQYKDLQVLHEKYAEKGLSILGFPANNFGSQEPGSNEQIKAFCTGSFGVEFDMFSKVSVKGDDCCPLYQFLTGEEINKEFAGPIKWNFTKFLVDGDGKIIARFAPMTKPSAGKVTRAIEAALGESAKSAS